MFEKRPKRATKTTKRNQRGSENKYLHNNLSEIRPNFALWILRKNGIPRDVTHITVQSYVFFHDGIFIFVK